MSRKVTVLVFAFLSFLIIRSFWVSTPGILEKVGSYCLYPIVKIESFIINWVAQRFQRRKEYALLVREWQEVVRERDELLASNRQLQAEVDFVKDTQELIAFRQRYYRDGARLAQVMMRNSTESEHFFLIDLGSRAGITPNMIAVWNNCLVGKVSVVYPLYSKVVLITDRRCKVSAYCSATQAVGIHEGTNTVDETRLCHVNHLETVVVGDRIFSSGIGAIFPRGFALGTVRSCSTDGLSYAIAVQPSISIADVKYCYLIDSLE